MVFLPVAIVFGICTLILLFGLNHSFFTAMRSRIFLPFLGMTVLASAFWQVSRRPTPGLVFAQSAALAVLALPMAAVLALAPVDRNNWSDTLGLNIIAFIFSAALTWTAIKSFQLWNLFRKVGPAELRTALQEFKERK
jgi:hypothetical protein